MSARVVFVGGPTASGKSALALELARALDGELVNADSQQVYRGMDVGTGKPTAAERALVPHHLYDLAEPWEQLDAARWSAEADRAIAAIVSKRHHAVVVGGTGLWMRALHRGLVEAPPRDPEVRARLEAAIAAEGLAALHARLSGVDPASAARIHATDPVRIVRALEVYELTGTPLSALQAAHAKGAPRYEVLHLAVDWPPDEHLARLRRRVEEMFDGGLLDETRALAADPRSLPRVERVMGYREALAHLSGALSREAAVDAVVLAHRRYAKRQRTWFRAEPEWRWLPGPAALEPALALARDFLALPR